MENGMIIDGLDEIELENTSIDDINSENINLMFLGIDQSGSMAIYNIDMKHALTEFREALMNSREAEELEESYRVRYCGDGYVLLQDLEGEIIFQELSDGEYPRYFAYNYVAPEALRYYKNGVEMKELYLPKGQYRRVGVATDGLRYVLQGDVKRKEEFLAALQSDKEVRVKRFVNKYQSFFKDDLTIAW